MSAWKPSLEIFNNLSNSGRPIIDRTGLAGTFDFILEWTPSPGDAYTVGPANSEFEGVTFPEAVKEQLGMKLESTKATLPTLLIDADSINDFEGRLDWGECLSG